MRRRRDGTFAKSGRNLRRKRQTDRRVSGGTRPACADRAQPDERGRRDHLERPGRVPVCAKGGKNRAEDPVSRHRGFQRTHQRTCAASALRPAEVYCLHERKGTHALLADAARMDGVAAFAPFSAGGFLLRGRRFDPERPGRGGAFGGCGAL